ncbi:MAG TPA: phosphotransferase family protein [Acidimicrobiales bacterium]|nr:phosphotransferase family protein [Acidimicrobiales bacterium]
MGRVTEWFSSHVPGAIAPLAFTLVAGGRSNLTFVVEDAAGTRFVLRRPPLGHVLPTAHDMAREHRLLEALAPTAVPVPRPYGLCTDESVNGAPFYVMEHVAGHVLRTPEIARSALSPEARARVGENLADVLAALHAVDVDEVGLGDLARRDGYIQRQLRRWSEQYRNMQVEGVDHGGVVERVGEALAARVPEQVGTSIVHGDFRLDNAIVGDDGTVAAILDWELCTLGDPLADVGLLLCYWAEPGDETVALGTAPTTTPGFLTRQELLTRYAAASGRDVSAIDFYVAFGYWKLACILQGVYARYVGGSGAGDPEAVDHYPRQVDLLAGLAASTLEEAEGMRR